MESGTTCVICIEEICEKGEEIEVLKCGHKLHNLCWCQSVEYDVVKTKKTAVSCPVCRMELHTITREHDIEDGREIGIVDNVVYPRDITTDKRTVLCVGGSVILVLFLFLGLIMWISWHNFDKGKHLDQYTSPAMP